jgi:uncharacterized membrane protein YeaQ/YmgE (transglycosylase-associated protein family)
MAEDVLVYFQDQLLVTIVFGLLAGFLASKTVAIGRSGHLAFFLAIGLIGSFVGQFAILYLGLDRIFDHVHQFRLVFDLIAAYIGAFILASVVHFIRPL